MAQGALPYEYEVSRSASGLTALAGLPAVLDLVTVLGLARSIDQHVQLRKIARGWSDSQQVLSLMLLNLAGGDCVDDLERLQADDGFQRLLRQVEHLGRPRHERRELERRFRKGERTRAVPSPTACRHYLEGFCNHSEEAKRGQGSAFVPAPSEALQGLQRVLTDLVAFAQQQSPEPVATLDLDATLVPTTKKEALYAYKDGLAFQPLNVWWAEQELLVRSEFRDGNVGAGHENLRVLKEALQALPEGIERVRFRADTASYQSELLRYLEEGRHPRFGRIEFAVGADVTQEFRAAVARLDESAWIPIYDYPEGPQGDPIPTGREVAEVVYVPGAYARTKRGEYRFLATRTLRDQPRLPGAKESEPPFPVYEVGPLQYKLRGIVTNCRYDDGWDAEDVVRFLDARCGRSEKAHDELKNDFAGGQLPSKHFGANAAWWQIAVLSLNLAKLFKRLALGIEWARKRMKAVRFHVLAVAGRVVETGRRMIVKLSEGAGQAAETLIRARQRIVELARGSPREAAT
jgi:hypothetical protein